MSNYILLAETGADIPPDIVKRYKIQIVPMHVSFGETTRDDGDFPTEEIFSYYQETGTLPQTSGSTPHDFMAKTMGFKEVLWVQTGSVVSTHCGPGAFGVCGFSI